MRDTRGTREQCSRTILLQEVSSAYALLLARLELSDTQVYASYIPALLGTASNLCEGVVLKKVSLPNTTAVLVFWIWPFQKAGWEGWADPHTSRGPARPNNKNKAPAPSLHARPTTRMLHALRA